MLTYAGDADTEWFSVLIPEWVSSIDERSADMADARNGAFSVAADARKQVGCCESDIVSTQRSPLVNLGHVIAGHLYRNRSFIIRNDSSVSLDFSLSSEVKHAALGGESSQVLNLLALLVQKYRF